MFPVVFRSPLRGFGSLSFPSASLVTGQNANLARKADRGTHKAETTTDATTHLIAERRVSMNPLLK
jgi:hypothetical protein